jgi:hypothetical protein
MVLLDGCLLYLIEQPGSGVGPSALGGRFRDAEHFCGFLDLHPDEVAELDQFRLLRFERGETVKGLIQCEQLIVGRGTGDSEIVHPDAASLCTGHAR